MSLKGTACLAMWWNMAAEMRSEFEHWHTHEHFPERLAIAGFERATRWTSATGGEGVFVMYELADWETLASPAYLAALNAPSPWSKRMMPHHRNMVRSQCRVRESRGAAVARQALTVRLSPAEGQAEALHEALKALAAELVVQPGLAGMHLLQHQPPAIAETTEQKIRGSADQGADWVLVVCGYEAAELEALAQKQLDDASLEAMGARAGAVRGRYALSLSAVTGDMQ